MCVLLRASDVSSPAWVRSDLAIDLPHGLAQHTRTALIRAILAELGAVQPPSTTEAVCYCGESVDLSPERTPALPRQRTGEPVMEAGSWRAGQ